MLQRGWRKRGWFGVSECEFGHRERHGGRKRAASVPQISTTAEISLPCPYNHRAPNSSSEIVRALVASSRDTFAVSSGFSRRTPYPAELPSKLRPPRRTIAVRSQTALARSVR